MKQAQHKTNGSAMPLQNGVHVVSGENLAVPLHLQKHFHVNELAGLWGTSPNTVRRWFEKEPDVMKISIGYRRGKDYRVCLRIPESVAERVHRKMCQVEV